jgi:hypothetical protein
LVGPGPACIRPDHRWLGLDRRRVEEQARERREEFEARQSALQRAIERIERLAAEASVPDDVLGPLRAHYYDRLR